jgi:raffinose/stachyose/melibiose transport system substrate-binding protein
MSLRSFTRIRRNAAIAIGLSALLLTAGCSALTPGASSGGTSAVTGKKLTSADVKKLGKVTLRLTDEGSTDKGDPLTKNIAKFEKQYPNVTISRQVSSYDQYGKTINLTLSGNNPPDVAEADGATAPRLVAGKLLKPMNAYYKAYDWTSRYPSSILAAAQLDPTGKISGTGDYWGVINGGEIVGIYYNAAELKKLGLTQPKTFAEFESDLAVAKAHGVTPIQAGNLEQIAAGHVLMTVLDVFEKPQAVQDWINGKPGSTFDTAGARKALDTIRDWNKKGYFPSQTNGTKDDTAAAAFAKGDGLFDITGSWRTQEFDQGLGAKGGFMLMPQMDASTQSYATGSFEGAYGIATKSKHADLAAFFLDYITGKPGSANNNAGDALPFTGTASAEGGPIANQVLAGWNTVSKDNGLTGYLDSAAPAMADTLFPGIQTLMVNKETSAQLASAIQQTWTEYRSGS